MMAGAMVSGRAPGTTGRAVRTRWWTPVAYVAAGWMVIFGAVHIYWALGGGLLLPAGIRVPDIPGLLVIDLIAIPLCAVGALVALSLVRPFGARIRLRWRLVAGWTAAAVALVHSAPTVILDVARAVGMASRELPPRAVFTDLVYEPWWFLGGLLFLAATVGRQRADGVRR